MNEQLERAREGRNILERLGSKIPGFSGYLEREMRREVDKLQRDWLAEQVDRARFAINGKIREWSRQGRLENLDRASSIEKALDRLELDRLYEFDLALTDTVEYLALQVEQLPETADEQMLSRLFDAVEGADKKFDERATVFEKFSNTTIRAVRRSSIAFRRRAALISSSVRSSWSTRHRRRCSTATARRSTPLGRGATL